MPKNLLEQFHRFANLYFLFIVLLNWIPAISAFGKEVTMIPVIFVLGVTAIKVRLLFFYGIDFLGSQPDFRADFVGFYFKPDLKRLRWGLLEFLV